MEKNFYDILHELREFHKENAERGQEGGGKCTKNHKAECQRAFKPICKCECKGKNHGKIIQTRLF